MTLSRVVSTSGNPRLATWKIVFAACAALAGLAVVALLAAFWRDISRHYDRVRQAGTVYSAPLADIEYTESGTGPPVLVVHGSGGGYDQGELIAEAVLGSGMRTITPSRFGYLGSSMPADATWDDQARAYAALLDHLGVGQVAVVAMSHGGPSALVFALLSPERVTSLTLISCGVAPSATGEQQDADRKGDTLTTLFRYDLAYSLASRLFRSSLLQLIGADKDVIGTLTPRQRALIDRIVDEMNPVSLRTEGVAFDNRTALPGERIDGIEAPTLVIHARDDRLQLFHNAEFADRHIPRSRLVAFDRGGHVLIAVERRVLRETVSAHVRKHFERPAVGSGSSASADEESR